MSRSVPSYKTLNRRLLLSRFRQIVGDGVDPQNAVSILIGAELSDGPESVQESLWLDVAEAMLSARYSQPSAPPTKPVQDRNSVMGPKPDRAAAVEAVRRDRLNQ